MADLLRPSRSQTILVVLLRLMALSELAALFAVVGPFAWVLSIHRAVGLGELPHTPVVEYLVRCLSAAYVLHGLLTLILTFNVPRYWPLFGWTAMGIIAVGVGLLGIDFAAGLPTLWTAIEGPRALLFGLLLLVLWRRASGLSVSKV